MKNILLISAAVLLLVSQIIPQEKILPKRLDDVSNKFTNVGNLGLTITNFGTYGSGFVGWPNQPSAEYPLGSGIEHIFDGGLWIGGFLSNDASGSGRQGPLVTTGAVDAASVSARSGGFEFTNSPGTGITERSSLLESRYYSPYAISHQDFVMDYVDTNTIIPGTSEQIVDHNPLGVAIRHESYAWNFPFANFFVIMNYWIKNVSNKYIDSVYVGLWTDAVVRNTKITGRPSGGEFYRHGGNGYVDSMKIAYEFDSDGDIGFTDSYIGFQLLGSTASYDSVNFNTWQFTATTDQNFFRPQTDFDRYRRLQGYFASNNRYGYGVSPQTLRAPTNRSVLISIGSMSSIAPGDSINVTFAIVAAKKFGSDPAAIDNDEQKLNLFANAEWALRAYYGEDRNRNGILDPGEDLNGDGIVTRYILPSPPTLPKVKVIPGNLKATIYWDKRAESSIDPISGKKDFEGYKVYRTNAGYDLAGIQDLQSALVLAAQFDSTDNEIGFNTGFSSIELNQPVTFDNDTTQYYYKMEIDNLLNGWQYGFSVTAFDEGDAENNLNSLESSPLANVKRIIPGTPAIEDDNTPIGVYPNPYYGSAYWDGSSERLRKIYLYNLPEECDITIYTLAGDIVKRMTHDKNSNSSELRWFENYSRDGSHVMSGGEQAWDLISDNDQAIATGMYLFSVKNLKTGKIKTGKFLIIK
jgi:hypothetical protein